MLTTDEARQLDRLVIGTLGASPSSAASELRSTRTRGHGLEFHDYRHYQPGDDPRTIDWTVDARLRQLVVRVFSAEGQVRLHLVMDISGSMAAGAPSKLQCASKIAAALAYLAIERRDSVGIATFADDIHTRIDLAGGRPHLFRVLETLESSVASGASNITRSLINYATTVKGPGLVVVLSDFYQAEMSLEGLEFLIYRDLTPAIVQIVSDDELEPEITGHAELRDLEEPSSQPLHVDRGAVDTYLSRMVALSDRLRDFSLRHGLPWLQLRSSITFEHMITACRGAGLLAPRR